MEVKNINEKYLIQLARGYISYLRGERPNIFPQTINLEDFPERLILKNPTAFFPQITPQVAQELNKISPLLYKPNPFMLRF